MATYAIGDIQGCFDQLQVLLHLIKFDQKYDKLWFTGDLVNRGPKSLEVLRYVKSLGECAVTVLGNHDLHLLALANRQTKLYSYDTLGSVLNAKDCQELCAWLRQQPLVHHDADLGFTLVHAGLPPQWDLHIAIHCAREVAHMLQSDRYPELLQHMYGNHPDKWSPNLTGFERLRFIINCLTRMRFCKHDGSLDLSYKGTLDSQPPELIPWFSIPDRANKNLQIIFGHWAALGVHRDTIAEPGIYALDSGCVWGNRLTALRLEDLKQFSVSCESGDRNPDELAAH